MDCAPDGSFKCESPVYVEGEFKGICGNEGTCEADLITHAATSYSAFVPGAGKNRRGWVVTCNCWNGSLERPCTLCDHIEQVGEEKQLKFPRKVRTYNVVVLGAFHEVQKNKKSGDGTYTILERCTGKLPRCQLCERGSEKIWGRRAYASFGSGFHSDLEEIDKAVGNNCKGCGEGSVQTSGYVCSGCDHLFLDLYEETLTAEDIGEFENTEIECESCGLVEYPVERVECVVEEDGEAVVGCETPIRTTIFDVNVKIKKTTADPPSLMHEDFSGAADLDGKYTHLTTPFEFVHLTKANPDNQAELLHIGGGGDRGAGARGKRARHVDYSH